MSLEQWKLIQRWAGVDDDGVPGPATARAIMSKLMIAEDPPGDIVKGTGKNISRIFIHCSATREGQDIDAAAIKRWHTSPPRNWRDIGYHFVIRLDGTIERGMPENKRGIHVKGYNAGSIGVVYIGGLDAQGKSKDTRTLEQKHAMKALVGDLVKAYPGSEVLGHRDISPDLDGDGVIEPHEWLKDCPCFNAGAWWDSVK